MAKFVIPHQHNINKKMRENLLKQCAHVFWFTGLSGSGKSTLAGMLETELHKEGYKTMLLDGDNIRDGLNGDLDFSIESRQENIRRLGHLCKLFTDAGIIVISAFVSPLTKDRQKVREVAGANTFFEIYVDCPLEICEKRDVKGLYKLARDGKIKDFTGISSPYEPPTNPEITIHSDKEPPVNSIRAILNVILPKIQQD